MNPRGWPTCFPRGTLHPGSLEPEIQSDPALDAAAAKLLPERAVLCHMASSQPNRQWPVRHWAAFYRTGGGGGLAIRLYHRHGRA